MEVTVCSVSACGEKILCRGYCRSHYKQLRKLGILKSIKSKQNLICKVVGCGCSTLALDLCERHYSQFKRTGTTKLYSYKVPNKVWYIDEQCFIELLNNIGEPVGVTTINKEDAVDVLQHRWCLYNTGYAGTRIKGKTILLHRLVTNFKEVDHIDRDRLNNTRSNLRECTSSQNKQNRLPREGCTSKYKGVCFDKSRQKYAARIRCECKCYNIGRFDTEIEAALAYNEYSLKYHKEFGYLNQIDQEDANTTQAG